MRHERAQLSNIFPYSRSRDSNHSGSGREGAQSAMSDDFEDTLDMLAAEIDNRAFPTSTSVIVGDSTGKLRSHSNTMIPTSRNVSASNRSADSQIIAESANHMPEKAGGEFANIAGQLRDGQHRQNHIASAAETLLASLRDALQALRLSQSKHDAEIQHNEQQLNTARKQSGTFSRKCGA